MHLMAPNERMHSDKLKRKDNQYILFQSKERAVTISHFVTKKKTFTQNYFYYIFGQNRDILVISSVLSLL